MSEISRKAFLEVTLVLTAAAATTTLLGCGGDDDGGGNGPGTKSCGSSGNDIADNHGHSLSIPAADLDSTTEKTYAIKGSSPHSHSVTLTANHLAQLKGGQSVTVPSTTELAHAHDLTVRCS